MTETIGLILAAIVSTYAFAAEIVQLPGQNLEAKHTGAFDPGRVH